MTTEKTYYERDSEVAAHLNMTLPEYLGERSKGTIPDLRKPLCSTPVVFIQDLDEWIRAGRPVAKIPMLGSSNPRNY